MKRGETTTGRQPPIARAAGFTLIELLVVIAILTLLMAALLPALQGAKKRARAVVCRVHLKQWGTTLAVYLEDQQGRFLGAADPMPGLSLVRGVCINPRTDPNDLKRYHAVETRGIACCPTATRTTGDWSLRSMNGSQAYLEMSGGGVFMAWEIRLPTPAFRSSYGINRNLFAPSLFSGSDILAGGSARELSIHAIQRCGTIPAILDAAGLHSWMAKASEPPPKWELCDPFPRSVGLLDNWDLCINRHNGALNALFLDWSVRPVGLKELWTLKWHGRFDTHGPWTKAGGVQPEEWPEWMREFKDY